MSKKIEIDVLGTKYTLEKLSKKQDKYLETRDGYCDKTSKRLVVCVEDEDNELDNFDVYQKVVIRHEIIHAFLFESGLHESWTHTETGHDETTVDWFAIQHSKLHAAFEQAGAL